MWGCLHVARDFTRLKNAEEALDLERRRLSAIIEGTRVGTWEWNVQTGETKYNERWAEIIGYTLAELAPLSIKTWTQYVHPDDLKASNEMIERAFQRLSWNITKLTAESRHKDGPLGVGGGPRASHPQG